MNSKWHFIVSNIKSLCRIIGCVATVFTGKLEVLAIWLLIAEVLGILEEVGDKR